MVKKLKPDAKEEDVRTGWVSVFTSELSRREPPAFLQYTRAPRLSEHVGRQPAPARA